MSYSGARPNELLIYLKPYSIPPYKTIQCAKWMVNKGIFQRVNSAINHLTFLELHHPGKFKHIMSEYFRITDYKGQYVVFNEHVNDITTNEEQYGQEQHMFY